ncbi:SDR family NAD(P)-dependent oxidoreductase [Oricola indica]|jgi:NAD(P)-dependent dehydrogenase (short-subunit alcohol dehydrogenase family)|uniref:SDR family NAD(P)-dependent oxidoreductase n=1 Tax=Oricola indica TaxID=2872591 RepID=UPI001CBCAF3D|nr:SDR family NAD(P)-dependent oxidoreductase [Oricola indica]
MRELDERVAIVSGGAMGIGRACVDLLVDAGAKVLIADFDQDAGTAAERSVVENGGTAAFVSTDVRDFGQVENATNEAMTRWGRIDILVNNAARAIPGVVDEMEEDAWEEVISNNLSSVWRFMKCVVPHMRRQKAGSVVNMSSVQALKGFHGWAGYAAAKGGINALTQQAALDLAPAGIRVNAVAPGTIMTPLNEKVFRETADPDDLARRWNEAHPIGRFGQPEEVAEAVLFLASDRSSFITGEILRVDGGLVIKGD